MTLCIASCIAVWEEVRTEWKKPHAFSLLWHGPLVFTGTSACCRECLVSTCPWRCKEIQPTSSPLPLPLSPLHARRRWQCPADALIVSTADAEEGSLPGVAEVRDLVTLELERWEAPL